MHTSQKKTKEAYYQIIDFFVKYLDKVFKLLGKSLLLESLEIIENEQYNDPNEIPYRPIIEKIFTNLKEHINKGKKSVALNLTYQSSEATLTDEQLNQQVENIVTHLESKFSAKLR